MTLDESKLGDIKKVFEDEPIVVDPIDTRTLTADSEMPIGIGGGNMETSAMGTTGLNTDRKVMKTHTIDLDPIQFPNIPPTNTVVGYLKSLDFDRYVEDFYDCEDIAFWGMAHARHRFPGCPIGVASGTAPDGHPYAGQRHAVIIVFHSVGGKIQPGIFWEPRGPSGQPIGKIDDLRALKSVVSFPIGAGKGPDTVPPLDTLERLDDQVLLFDETRMIYPLQNVLDYLKKECSKRVGQFRCDENHKIFGPARDDFNGKWRHYDQALWAFAHVRRDFPGCPICVAIGDRVDGKSFSVVVIWYCEGDKEGADLKYMYWDPDPDVNKKVDFKPKMIFG